jgi:hypothetical protein
MSAKWRARTHNSDRVNRAVGRAQAIIERHAARNGEKLGALYVSEQPRRLQQIAGKPKTELWLTTWTGQRLARLYVTGTAYGFHGARLTCYSCTLEGRNYFGRGQGPGMLLMLRPGKPV